MVQKLSELRAVATLEGAQKFAADASLVKGSLGQVNEAAKATAAGVATSDQRIIASAGSYERLVRQIDPAYAAQQQFARGERVLQQALEKGRIDLQEHALRVDQLRARYEFAGEQVVGFAARAGQATASGSRMGSVMQNAGYQVGDFAVQVASGQGFMRPFIQQGTQLISMFGPWGAVIGAAGAVLGALYTSLWNTKDAAGAAGDALGVLSDANKELNAATEKGIDLTRRQAFEFLRKAEAAEAAARAEMYDAQAILTRRQADLDSSHAGGFTGAQVTQARLQAEINAAQERLNDFGGEADAARAEIDRVKASLNGLGSSFAATADENERLIAAMQVSQYEYDVTVKTIEILKGGYAGTEDQARALAEVLVGQKETLDGLTKSISAATKESDKYTQQIEKASASFESYLAQLDLKNIALQNEISGHSELNPLLEAEAKLAESMGRDLLPAEIAQLKTRVEQNQRLTAELKAHHELEKEAQKQAEQVGRAWERAGENIQNSIADAIFSGKNAFESLRSIALDVARQIAAAMIFNPIIQPMIGTLSGLGASGSIGGLVNGSGSSLFGSIGSAFSLLNSSAGTLGNAFVQGSFGQSLGLSTGALSGIGPANATSLGSSLAGIGNVLGAGGIGYGLGSLISGFGIGNSTGSGIGGALGGAIGSIIPGIGTIIGSIGGALIGGLFGNSQPSNLFARQNINLADGTLGRLDYNPSEYSQQNVDAATGGAQAFLALEKQITALIGGATNVTASLEVGSRDGIYAMVGSSGKRFANSDAGFQQALDFMVKSFADQLTGVTNEAYQKAIARGATGQEIIENINYVSQYLAIADAGVSALADAIKTINDAYDESIAKANELGLATDALNAARDKDIASVRAQYDAQVRSLQQSGRAQAEQFFGAQLDPLLAYRDQLTYGADSVLAPQAQYAQAQDAFRGLDLSTANASDIVAAGQTYLQQARSYGASGDIYQSAFREVNGVLSGRIETLEQSQSQVYADLGVSMATSIADQTAALQDSLAEIKDAIDKLNKTIKAAA